MLIKEAKSIVGGLSNCEKTRKKSKKEVAADVINATEKLNELLLNANELIRDVVEDRVLDDEPLSIEAYERLEAWVDRAIQWSKDYGAYTNREFGNLR